MIKSTEVSDLNHSATGAALNIMVFSPSAGADEALGPFFSE